MLQGAREPPPEVRLCPGWRLAPAAKRLLLNNAPGSGVWKQCCLALSPPCMPHHVARNNPPFASGQPMGTLLLLLLAAPPPIPCPLHARPAPGQHWAQCSPARSSSHRTHDTHLHKTLSH